MKKLFIILLLLYNDNGSAKDDRGNIKKNRIKITQDGNVWGDKDKKSDVFYFDEVVVYDLPFDLTFE